MPGKKIPTTLIGFLEEIRAIAQVGLNYAKDPYDKQRYERLLELSTTEYSKLSGLSEQNLLERFRVELGYITPKVGAEAAIFTDIGQLLLVRRTDDNLWCLPCGWADVCETVEEAVQREVLEETGLKVQPQTLLEITSRLPGMFDSPHTSYHIMFHCIVTGGEIKPSHETSEVGYFDHTIISDWHKDHKERAHRAYLFWLKHIKC